MDPITLGMLGMSGLNMIQNVNQAARDRTLQAAKERYSPWTGLKGQDPQVANPVGDLAQGGAAALGYAQQKKLTDSNDRLREAQIQALNRTNNPYGRIRGYDMMSIDPMTGSSMPMSPLGDYQAGPYGVARG